ncbi:hypothetical protein NZK35_24115 [Stieleria sp. ICT_E10.1]|uniref:hypothetical protein n=1 Tax=Stieleria sedimenti TaxID=2976331 RepID=UPI00217F3ED1|nr:hypothetical protein [Stieleria sedimenti]MCS7469749.1 hypothetical protein [Stieleria sedimenti]
MPIKEEPPKTGDMYRCQTCDLEIHITQPCTCEAPTVEFACCGKPLKKVTALPAGMPS